VSPRKKAPEDQKKEDENSDENEEFEKYSQSAYKWSRALTVNKSLVHLDFSFNQLKINDVKILGEGLKLNH